MMETSDFRFNWYIPQVGIAIWAEYCSGLVEERASVSLALAALFCETLRDYRV